MSLHREAESSLSYCYGEYRHDEVSVPNYANKVELRLEARSMAELWKEPKSMLMCGHLLKPITMHSTSAEKPHVVKWKLDISLE